MKFDIENKILIPFMILAILPITILGIVSYWNGYQLLMNDTEKYMNASLSEAIFYVDSVAQKPGSDANFGDAKKQAIDYFELIDKNDIIIIENSVVLLNNSESGRIPEALLSADGSSHRLNEKDALFLYDRYDEWGWTIAIVADKKVLVDDLLDIQKYIMLMAIIFLVISMQAIIFIAHNISKPIKHFADVCRKIEINNLNKIDLIRSDEIGVLANSFNNMIDQLNASTENLIEMKKFNDDILANISIGIMTTDNDGNLLSINNTGKRIFEQYLNSYSIFSTLSEQIRHTISEGRDINKLVTINTEHDSAIVYLDVSTSLLKKDHGQITGAICSFADITSRKNLENNFVRVNRLAYVGQFAAGLAHEIRNPLTGMKTSIQVIKNRLTDRSDQSSIELTDGIIYEIDRINKLITELLDFSKVRKTNKQKTDLLKILKRSLDLSSEGIEKKKIDVQLHTFSRSVFVYVDPGQAEQIFLNIITNAIQAMSGNGKLTISVDKDPTRYESYVRITFDDNGSGISEEARERIFDPFFTTKSKGTGLGLSVVAKLLEENDGYVELESAIDEGSKFKVYLLQTKENENED